MREEKFIGRGTSREDREGRVQGGDSSVSDCISAASMADGRPRITVTSARTATASLVARRGEGVDRRAPHQGPLAGERLAREVSERRVERRVELPPPPVEAAVETVSAAEVSTARTTRGN